MIFNKRGNRVDNNGIMTLLITHSHTLCEALSENCLNAATLKMISYLLNVGDTRGEQCSLLIG